MALALQGSSANGMADAISDYVEDMVQLSKGWLFSGPDNGSQSNVYGNIAKAGTGSFSSWTGWGGHALAPKPGELAKLLGIWTP